MAEEVAMFIDLENLRYGLLHNYGQEPDFQVLVEKARKYGRPSVMKAYADFTEHPSDTARKLQVAGIEAISVPVKRTMTSPRGGQQVERVKNAADMVLALDAVTEALEADSDKKSKVFLLVTGDRDYVKLVTLLRYKFGQQVVVAGVPGSVAGDLIAAAGKEDPIVVPSHVAASPDVLKKAIVAMVKKGPAPLRYWTLKTLDQWAQDDRQAIPGTAKERRDVIAGLLQERTLLQREIINPKTGRPTTETFLDEAKARERGYL